MKDTNDFSELNPVQTEAVTASLQNMLVLAGAGSGKTKVLVNRIAWLLNNHAMPAHILAVTFTNKAAYEMRERLQKMLSMSIANMWVGTFHGIAHRLLRMHCQELGLAQDFQILDSDEQLKLIKQVQKSLNLSEEKWPYKQTQWFINAKKDDGFRSDALALNGDYFNDTLINVYSEYAKICAKNHLVDFADLLLYSYELWRNNPEVLKHYQQRFRHVLVDEFQDTNGIQYDWLKLLLRDSTFTIVGDDDQSIYGWRGARVENIQSLSFDFPGLKVIRMEQNYRSTGNILQAANVLISHNKRRLGKELWTSASSGELITLYAASNEIEEARYVVGRIKDLIGRDKNTEEIAILYRSNAQSRIFEEKLLQESIPYQIYGNLKFSERAEVKDALAYLRLLVNPNDDTAFARVINVPARGIGETTLNALREYGRDRDLSLWSATKEMIASNKFTVRTINLLTKFLELIEFIHTSTDGCALDKQIECILLHTGLYQHYKTDQTEKGQMRVENLDELINTARRFSQSLDSDLSPASVFLAQLALESGDEKNIGERRGVQLMTLHSAKGLEFPVVFLVGMENGLFPHQLSYDDPDGIEEERRLCYVGMTRAMQKLYLTYAYFRRLHGTQSNRMRSRFIDEIPVELLAEANNVKVTPVQHYVEPSYIGRKVFHPKFGNGIIMDFADGGDLLKVQINFAYAGIKWLAANHPLLQIL